MRRIFLPSIAALLISAVSTLPAQETKFDSAKKQLPNPIQIGEKAPDFELESLGNKVVKLSDRAGKNGKTVVLLFSRASW